MVDSMENPTKMDDDWVYPYFRKPSHVKQIQFGFTNLYCQHTWAVLHVQLELSVQLLFRMCYQVEQVLLPLMYPQPVQALRNL